MTFPGLAAIHRRYAAALPADPAVRACLARVSVREAEGRYRARAAAWLRRAVAARLAGLRTAPVTLALILARLLAREAAELRATLTAPGPRHDDRPPQPAAHVVTCHPRTGPPVARPAPEAPVFSP